MRQSNMGRHEEQNRRRGTGNIVMWLAGALFCLVVLTTYLSAGLFARYVTRDDGGDDARVITFGKLTVKENDVAGSPGQEYVFIPGVDLTKKVTVSFDGSEADTFVFISLDTTGWEVNGQREFTLKDKDDKVLLTWSVDTAWNYLTAKEIRDGGGKLIGMQHVYYIRLDANNKLTEQHVLTGDKITVSQATRATYEALSGMKLDLNITATAVQANGFYTAENDTEPKVAAAAWNSVNK